MSPEKVYFFITVMQIDILWLSPCVVGVFIFLTVQVCKFRFRFCSCSILEYHTCVWNCCQSLAFVLVQLAAVLGGFIFYIFQEFVHCLCTHWYSYCVVCIYYFIKVGSLQGLGPNRSCWIAVQGHQLLASLPDTVLRPALPRTSKIRISSTPPCITSSSSHHPLPCPTISLQSPQNRIISCSTVSQNTESYHEVEICTG